MKFISWNVNGIRACVKKGFLDFFNETDADIFCIQESKMQEGQLDLDLPGYHQYWNYAVKKGYSGTGIFTKEEPISVSYGLGIEEHDQEGRVITLEFEDYYFITDEDGAVTNYVWAVDANDKLEKREVTLGDFNDETFKYEVLDGLTVDDYIAFPGDDCVEGAPVTRNADDLYDDTGEDDLDDGNWDNDGLDDGSLDENMDWGEEGNLDSLDENFEDAGYGEEVYE